jgi:hypothetical protein
MRQQNGALRPSCRVQWVSLFLIAFGLPVPLAAAFRRLRFSRSASASRVSRSGLTFGPDLPGLSGFIVRSAAQPLPVQGHGFAADLEGRDNTVLPRCPVSFVGQVD